MADDSTVEKFILQYTVDSEETVKRLEEINKKLEDVMTRGKKSADSVKTGVNKVGAAVREGIGKAVPEVGQLADTLGSVPGKLGAIGTAASVAAAGVAILAAGIAAAVKSANEFNKVYQEQKKTGYESGMSEVSVEQHGRTFNAATGFSRDETGSLLRKVSGMTSAAYQNVDPMSKENQLLRMAGVSARNSSGIRTSTNDALEQMSKKFQSVSMEQAKAIGLTIGLTAREVEALRARNSEVEKAAQMTDYEIARRQRASEAAERLNAAQSRMSESWERLKLVLGEEFLPIIADIYSKISDFFTKIPGAIDDFLEGFHKFMATLSGFMDWFTEFDLKLSSGHLKEAGEIAMAGPKAWIDKAREAQQAQQAKDKEIAEKNLLAAEKSQATADKNIMLMNLFGMSVDNFAKATDDINNPEYQAAWAGSVGAAGGLFGIGSNPRFQGQPQTGANAAAPIGGYSAGSGKATNSAYDDLFKKYWGDQADMGKAIMMAESGGVNKRTSSAGAQGLMQLMPQYWSDKGNLNLMDPETNIRQGRKAFEWAQSQAAKKGLTGDALIDETLRYYNGGANRGSKENIQYPGRVREYLPTVGDATHGFNNVNTVPQNVNGETPKPLGNGIHANTRSDYYAMKGEEKLAASMGVPVAQLRLGELPAKDLQIAAKTQQFNASLELQKAQANWDRMKDMKYDKNTPEGMRMEAIKASAYQKLNEANKNYMISNAGAQPYLGGQIGTGGDRSFTLNNTFNIYGSGNKDAERLADDIIQKTEATTRSAIKTVVNSNNSMVKS